MALRKCPKCELNYLKPGETICHVCAAAMKRRKPAAVEEEEVVMCSNCGEAPAAGAEAGGRAGAHGRQAPGR